ncbi:hypothetical protein HC928_03215 [bacterium]|nr:hypothetical protein [bacterium]
MPRSLAAQTLEADDAVCERPLDVLFILDVSSSMDSSLSVAQANSTQIIDTLGTEIPDLRLALASVVDYPAVSSGDRRDYPWRLDAPLTTNLRDVQQALLRLQILDGDDPPESYLRALSEAQDTSQLGWRSESDRVIVLWGDAPTVIPTRPRLHSMVHRMISRSPVYSLN